jgi:hypothetical protein
VLNRLPGNYFTVAEVEKKKIKKALFTENTTTWRASDDTWKRNDRMGNLKLAMGESGESQGKRKIRDFNGGGEEVTKKKKSTKSRRLYKPSGVLPKDDKKGLGLAETGNQPCRLQ